jgi:hypothetical protein
MQMRRSEAAIYLTREQVGLFMAMVLLNDSDTASLNLRRNNGHHVRLCRSEG